MRSDRHFFQQVELSIYVAGLKIFQMVLYLMKSLFIIRWLLKILKINWKYKNLESKRRKKKLRLSLDNGSKL